MAELEKLNDKDLDAVGGGTKYNVSNQIIVRWLPNNQSNGFVLTNTDYLVTDGEVVWVDGSPWTHVHTAYGNGYVNGIL